MISRRKFLGGLLLSGFTFVFSDSLYFEKYFVETNEFDIGTKKHDSSKIRIIQISDLHLRKLKWHHNALAQRINAAGANLILFTGDIIEKHEDLPHLDNFLRLLNHNTPKVAIAGNWEHVGRIDFNRLKELYLKNNGELLINQSKVFTFNGKRLVVTGVDDMLAGSPDFLLAVNELKREENHIVLCHCPEYRDCIEREAEIINREKPENEKLKIDYVFAGHSHGGQVNLLGYAPFLPEGVGPYVRGWYKERLPNLYVSKGIGTSIFPVRFGARAELVIFNYHLA